MSLLVLHLFVYLFFCLFRFCDTFYTDFASILQKRVYSKHTYVSACPSSSRLFILSFISFSWYVLHWFRFHLTEMYLFFRLFVFYDTFHINFVSIISFIDIYASYSFNIEEQNLSTFLKLSFLYTGCSATGVRKFKGWFLKSK